MVLKNGRKLIVKEAEEIEAKKLIRFISAVGNESKFLRLNANDYKIKALDEEKFIKICRESDNQTLLIGWVHNKIVAHLFFRSSILQRMMHIGEVGISVSKNNWGMGIGTSIMNSFIEWARRSKVIRIVRLRVHSDNNRAIAIYKKLGFTEEKSIVWSFFDNLIMGLKLN